MSSCNAAYRILMHRQLGCAIQKSVQKAHRAGATSFLSLTADNLLEACAQSEDALIGVHLLVPELLHVALNRLDVTSHLHMRST